jgi:hypothetical protein
MARKKRKGMLFMPKRNSMRGKRHEVPDAEQRPINGCTVGERCPGRRSERINERIRRKIFFTRIQDLI